MMHLYLACYRGEVDGGRGYRTFEADAARQRL